MTVAPLRRPPPLATRASARQVTLPRARAGGRRWLVLWAKRLLPVGAMLLLAGIALWPEISRQIDPNRVKLRRGLVAEFEAGMLLHVRYRGVDGERPYTITADEALQDGPERLNLVEPKGDLTSENGSWTYVESRTGVYIQHASLLDLSGDVVVFRDNGVTLRTPSVSADLGAGAAAGNEPTHAEGPFGTLDAQGFALVDKGAVIQFQGTCHLHLNGARQ